MLFSNRQLKHLYIYCINYYVIFTNCLTVKKNSVYF